MKLDDLRKTPHPIFGCVIGILWGGMYSLFAAFRYILQGTALFDRIGVPFESLVGLYLVAGAVGGTLVGSLLPLTVRPLGAAFVGMVGALPVYLGSAILLGHKDFSIAIPVAVVIGGLGGLIWWEPIKKPPK